MDDYIPKEKTEYIRLSHREEQNKARDIYTYISHDDSLSRRDKQILSRKNFPMSMLSSVNRIVEFSPSSLSRFYFSLLFLFAEKKIFRY